MMDFIWFMEFLMGIYMILLGSEYEPLFFLFFSGGKRVWDQNIGGIYPQFRGIESWEKWC